MIAQKQKIDWCDGGGVGDTVGLSAGRTYKYFNRRRLASNFFFFFSRHVLVAEK
jgi:hypothetical protein